VRGRWAAVVFRARPQNVGLITHIRPWSRIGSADCEDRLYVFRFLLKLEDGEPTDPAVFVTAVPNWTVDETFSTGRGEEWRILAIDTDIDEELVELHIAPRSWLGHRVGTKNRLIWLCG
jgi:hypothetical protein